MPGDYFLSGAKSAPQDIFWIHIKEKKVGFSSSLEHFNIVLPFEFEGEVNIFRWAWFIGRQFPIFAVPF